MRLLLGLILVIIGVLAVVAGVLYLTQQAHALPSFFPGHVVHGSGKLEKHGLAAVIGGAVVFVIGVAVMASGRRRAW